MTSKPAIGFCGLGAMGFGMAAHLVSAGYAVTGYDLNPKALEAFQAKGGHAASTLAESARDKPFYIVMVATAQQAQSAIFEGENAIITTLPDNVTLFLCSTVPPSYAHSLAAQLQAHKPHVHLIDCPVSGGAGRAATGTLTIMASGTPAALAAGDAILRTLADPAKLFLVAGGVGQGSYMKLTHQVLAACQILAASEAVGFGAALGLAAETVRRAVLEPDDDGKGREAWSWMFENRVPRMIGRAYAPPAAVSAVTIILKDAGIITATARERGVPVPLCAAAEQVYLAALSRGWGAEDDAGVVRMYYADPVAEVREEGLEEGERRRRLRLVLDLLVAVHTLAAAEALALASHVGIPLRQLYELAKDAAGGSTMFEMRAVDMIDVLEGRSGEVRRGRTVRELVQKVSGALEEARKVRCPLFLGAAAEGVLRLAERRLGGDAGDAELVRAWAEKSI